MVQQSLKKISRKSGLPPWVPISTAKTIAENPTLLVTCDNERNHTMKIIEPLESICHGISVLLGKNFSSVSQRLHHII